ncbi:hypothetical protein [Coleofasciculus sp. E1-EBD-02]|uniref:hypothetical protein n=1 Tax=Coleofasciculus sp. E1-EBD-02 TaxID=3068481 RepID=UPI0032F70BF8
MTTTIPPSGKYWKYFGCLTLVFPALPLWLTSTSFRLKQDSPRDYGGEIQVNGEERHT